MASAKTKHLNKEDLLKQTEKNNFFDNIANSRISEGENVLTTKFNKKRCRLLTQFENLDNEKGIIYWMYRECRVQDNWALLYAQRLSLKFDVPFQVCFFVKDCVELYPTTRHTNFLKEGLKNISRELNSLNIAFHVINSSPLELLNIIKANNIGCVVCEFIPLRKVTDIQNQLKESLPEDVSLVQVDAHNIVPCWMASEKQEIAARTIRRKIVSQLPEFLTPFPPVCKHSVKGNLSKINAIDLNDSLSIKWSLTSIEDIKWATPGPDGGLEMLRTFLVDRLQFYGVDSNDPSKKHLSNLSPWLHFGQISSQRCALEAKVFERIYKDQVAKFLEELIVRKELSDNFCYYNPLYDQLKGADNWAQTTLNLHRNDKRSYLYTQKQLEEGLTHDKIWNSAQLQLTDEGKLHGYMRMYWCKKILEWTESPEEAIRIALYLNDTYSLDGSDPNGFVGVMWSICGVHDHPWKERPVFGKVRYMVDYSLVKKFDIETYCATYGVKNVTKTNFDDEHSKVKEENDRKTKELPAKLITKSKKENEGKRARPSANVESDTDNPVIKKKEKSSASVNVKTKRESTRKKQLKS